MLELKKYTDFAEIMTEFAETLLLSGITIEDLEKLDEIAPISNDVKIIKKWWGESTESAKPAPKPEKPETKVEPVLKRSRRPHGKLTNSKALVISEYIATRHNDDTVADTIADCTKEFKIDDKKNSANVKQNNIRTNNR